MSIISEGTVMQTVSPSRVRTRGEHAESNSRFLVAARRSELAEDRLRLPLHSTLCGIWKRSVMHGVCRALAQTRAVAKINLSVGTGTVRIVQLGH